jgi:exodeoxyribonuclease V gamma subunit
MLCGVVRAQQPADPFLQFPIVVGSRGMERWLRHEIATRIHIAAGLAFPFPRQALAGAARWLLDGAKDARAPFWQIGPGDVEQARRWEREALALQLVLRIREHLGDDAFGAVARYLAEDSGADESAVVSARELLFASEVGDVLDRMMHDRPAEALDWARDPSSVDERHRWLAALLADIDAHTHPFSPAVLHRELIGARPQSTRRPMCIFGLSTMGPGDRERLVAIAQSMEVHLFVLVPTNEWFRHQRTRVEASAARREAKTDADREQLEEELAGDNPILTSLGAPSRDLQQWLEQVGYLGDQVQAVDPLDQLDTIEEATVLQRLQSWILASDGMPAPECAWAPDASVSLHSTYGAMRQCEVLRDELLGMFAADPTLEPRDVVVMTPDIEVYAPLLEAVFARRGQTPGADTSRLPPIPVSIADLGLRRTNPVAEVLLQILGIAGERLGATWVMSFLALQPVRLKWKIDDDDLSDLRELVRDSGLRWGVDASDRGSVGQPELDQNTVRFALERLALGVLMPDEAPLGVVPGPLGHLDPAVPFAVESQGRVRRVGQLIGLLRAIAAHRRILGQPATLEVWRERLLGALDALASTTETTGWLRAEVDQALDDLARLGGLLGETRVDRAAVQHWLEGGFELPQRGDRVITGAVAVCALEPMRSVPFRVVALVGMDDKALPRGGRARTWDPMEQRRTGERDRREVDRHLMLEAILSARERLLILWSGRDVAQGNHQPAAVPVEELLELLCRLTGEPRAQVVREHALQPWSAGNFGHAPQSFDWTMANAAQRLREIEVSGCMPHPLGLAASGSTALPAEQHLPDTLEIEALVSALVHPHKLLLSDRLKLGVSYEDAVVEDREPLELDTLEAWALRSSLVRQLMEDTAGWTDEALVEALRARVAGEGTLPLRAGGRAVLAVEAAKARAVIDNFAAVAGEVTDSLELGVQLDDGMQLTGAVHDVVLLDGKLLLQWWTPSSQANDKARLGAWLHLLVAVAAGHPVAGARLVGHGSSTKTKAAGGDFMVFNGTVEEARAALAGHVAVWRRARQEPLPLFPKTSMAAAKVLLDHEDDLDAPGARVALVGAVATGFHGDKFTKGDIHDRWITTFFVDYDPTQQLRGEEAYSLIGLARRVWYPVLRGLNKGKGLARDWKRRGEA